MDYLVNGDSGTIMDPHACGCWVHVVVCDIIVLVAMEPLPSLRASTKVSAYFLESFLDKPATTFSSQDNSHC